MVAPLSSPQVSVVMAVHNGLPYVESAVRSVMQQSLRDIEIIIVDDASGDDTPTLLARLAKQDPRIRLKLLRKNVKTPSAVNKGLAMVRAPLVARMDADDLSLPDRLMVQKKFMDQHPDIALCGSSIAQIDASGKTFRTSRRARDAFATRWLARFFSPLCHPTFMFRATGRDGAPLRYDPAYPFSEDYDFAARLLRTGDAVSLPEVLMKYRVHSQSTTATKYRTQLADAQRTAMMVQTDTLPADIRAALGAFNTAYFELRCENPAQLFAGMRRMIAADLHGAPTRRAWMKRQAAQLIVTAIRRSGGTRFEILRAFGGSGRDFLLALIMRYLEVRRLLPRALRSDPVVWSASWSGGAALFLTQIDPVAQHTHACRETNA
ncbi:MAG: glycosyltransferase family 2 protein [Paracoccaceae bacterium]